MDTRAMAIISDQHNCITAMVTFDCNKGQQNDLCRKIKAYISDFISQQDGLISSHLHKSLCGKHVVNYAQWQSMPHFKAFAKKAADRPELPELLAFSPKAVFYEVAFSVET